MFLRGIIFIKEKDEVPIEFGSNKFITKSNLPIILPNDLLIGLLKQDIRTSKPDIIKEQLKNFKPRRRIDLDVFRCFGHLDSDGQLAFAKACQTNPPKVCLNSFFFNFWFYVLSVTFNYSKIPLFPLLKS